VPASETAAKLGWQVDAGDFLHLAPHRQGCDAFFAAVLERRERTPV
jgi:16S rRNA C967 or C1407 C5-methylase (RsmB/RsmF family)